jgi:transcriptional regulator with XRE-family HTH domain
MDAARQRFAENLRAQRKRAGLTQERLAEICELHRTAISLLERRKRSPRLETMLLLAQGLGLSSLDELLDGVFEQLSL